MSRESDSLMIREKSVLYISAMSLKIKAVKMKMIKFYDQ